MITRLPSGVAFCTVKAKSGKLYWYLFVCWLLGVVSLCAVAQCQTSMEYSLRLSQNLGEVIDVYRMPMIKVRSIPKSLWLDTNMFGCQYFSEYVSFEGVLLWGGCSLGWWQMVTGQGGCRVLNKTHLLRQEKFLIFAKCWNNPLRILAKAENSTPSTCKIGIYILCEREIFTSEV